MSIKQHKKEKKKREENNYVITLIWFQIKTDL